MNPGEPTIGGEGQEDVEKAREWAAQADDMMRPPAAVGTWQEGESHGHTLHLRFYCSG